jgi:hypothetical protein
MIQVRIQETTSIDAVTFGPTGIKTTAKATTPGQFLFPGSDFNSGKPIEIWTVRCDTTRYVGVLDPAVAFPETCDKNRRIGEGVWVPGATISATSGVGFGGRGGPGIRPFINGGIDFSAVTGLSGACSVTDERYVDAGYNEWTCATGGSDVGWNVGGGAFIGLGLGRKIPHVMVGFNYAKLGGPTYETSGTRVLNDLAFNADAELAYTIASLRFGPKFALQRQVYVTPFVSVNWWRADLTYTDSLSVAGTPVQGGTDVFETSDRDWGFGARVDWKFDRKFPVALAIEASVNRIRGFDNNIFGEFANVPWPRDQKIFTVAANVTYRLPQIRLVGRVPQASVVAR